MNYKLNNMNVLKKGINKKIILFFLISFVTVTVTIAQGRMRERLQAQKVAFFTEKIDLTADEAEKFWPVYNDFSGQKESINREQRFLTVRLSKNIDSMEEDEIVSSLEAFVELREKDHALFTEFHKKFLDILPPEKVMKVYLAEMQFKQYLLKEIQNRHQRRRH